MPAKSVAKGCLLQVICKNGLRVALFMLLAATLLACDVGDPEVARTAPDACDRVQAAGDSQQALDEVLQDAEQMGQFRSAVVEQMQESCPELLEGLDHGAPEPPEFADFEIRDLRCRPHRAEGTVHNASNTARDVRIVVDFVADGEELSRVDFELSDVSPGQGEYWEVRSGVRTDAEDCAANVAEVR